MKTFSLVLMLLVFGMSAMVFTASTSGSTTPSTGHSKLMWVPQNAKVVKVNAHTVEVVGGNKYEYVALDEKGKLLPPVLGATVSCTCSAGSGCSPFSGHGQQGCALGNCTNCTGTVSVKAPGLSGGAVQTYNVSSGGFLLKNVKADFATVAEVKEAASVFGAMFKTEKVQSALALFNAKLKANPDEVQVYALVSVGGRISVMEVPKKFALKNKAIVLSAKGSCSCTEGSCSYDSTMGVGYCSGDCSGTCSLTTGFKVSGNEIAIETYSF